MTDLEWQKLENTIQQMTPGERQRLRDLLGEPPLKSKQSPSEKFLEELSKVIFDAPALPTDFSRADIYSDHD